MITFLIGIAILIGGYFTYGKFVEHVFGPDDRKTPALENPDGVDRVPMAHWKNVLIQLLNIAGIGPVIGVILGIKFGVIVFILLPIGNVLGGAVHDYFSGMISMRNNGYNVPALSRKFLGKIPAKVVMTLISVALILVGAVFTNTPAALINTPILAGSAVSPTLFWIAVACIFAYYFASTFFPIDKIIGRIYPIFGALLILASLAIFLGIIPNLNVLDNFCFSDIMSNFHKHPGGQPIIPMLFVTIACGIISGFHSTQSPLVARTEVTEKTGRQTFYGMMIIEGLDDYRRLDWHGLGSRWHVHLPPDAGTLDRRFGRQGLEHSRFYRDPLGSDFDSCGRGRDYPCYYEWRHQPPQPPPYDCRTHRA